MELYTLQYPTLPLTPFPHLMLPTFNYYYQSILLLSGLLDTVSYCFWLLILLLEYLTATPYHYNNYVVFLVAF